MIEDRFPYGNAILVESHLDALSPFLLDSIPLPTPAPTALNHPVLTCPQIDFPMTIENTDKVLKQSVHSICCTPIFKSHLISN